MSTPLAASTTSICCAERHALELARNLGYPVVIKPDDQEQGRGVSAGLRDDAALVIAYRADLEHSRTILVEKHHRFDSVTVAGQDAAPDADKVALTNSMAMLKGGATPNITSMPQFLRSR